MATLDPQKGEEPSLGSMEATRKAGSAPSPQSEAVTNELQELSLQPAPNLLPLRERKNGETLLHANLRSFCFTHLAALRVCEIFLVVAAKRSAATELAPAKQSFYQIRRRLTTTVCKAAMTGIRQWPCSADAALPQITDEQTFI